MDYFTALVHIVKAMQMMGEDTPMDLQNLILEERMRNRITRDDFIEDVTALSSGNDGCSIMTVDTASSTLGVSKGWTRTCSSRCSICA